MIEKEAIDVRRLPAVVKRQIATASLPENYEAAKLALSACSRIDECKEWSDRMAAMATYARQARDTSMEEMATRIRHRAIRRIGELLESIPKTTLGKRSERLKAAASSGLTKRNAERAMRIARIPVAEFETTIAASPPPSISALDPYSKHAPEPTIRTQFIGSIASLKTLVVDLGVTPQEMMVHISSPDDVMRKLGDEVLAISEFLDQFERNIRKFYGRTE